MEDEGGGRGVFILKGSVLNFAPEKNVTTYSVNCESKRVLIISSIVQKNTENAKDG